MTSRITQVRQALAATLVAAEIPDLTVYSFMPGQVVTPAVIVTPTTNGQFLTYRTSYDSHDLTLEITVFVQRGQDESTSELLDSFLDDAGDHSIFAAVQADPTLGGVVDNASVISASNWGVWTFGQLSYLAVVFSVEILL